MPNKVYNVTVTLPDLAAAHAEQEAKVESSNWPIAIKLACEEISRRPHVRGKHIKSAKFHLAIIDSEVVVPPATPKQPLQESSDGVQFSLFQL